MLVGVTGFEPATSPSRTVRACLTAPHPDANVRLYSYCNKNAPLAWGEEKGSGLLAWRGALRRSRLCFPIDHVELAIQGELSRFLDR